MMAAIVQATCPGCKNVLRIPADWVHQPIRCKHCGLVMLSKNPPPAPAAKPATARVPKAAPEAVVPADTVPMPIPPAAVPVNGFPFAELAKPEAKVEAAAALPRRAVKKAGSLWLGVVIACSVVVLAGVILVGVTVGVGWSKISKLLQPPSPAVIKDKEQRNLDKDEGPPKDPSKDGTPTDGKHDPNKDKPPPPKDKPADPNKDKLADPNKDKPADPNKDKPTKPAPVAGPAFPRRALVISLHNYLYAATVHPGNPGNAHNLAALKDKLTTGLRVPRTQIGVLSDVVSNEPARSPTKSVIQETLVKFLETTRAQDRILVFFIGHAVEIGDDVYLVPIEGELDNPANLIPLKWVYKELADCKARQKVLVLDVCRANPSKGADRPGTGPMGPKLAAALNAPPEGVQVWSACGEGQFSYETDASPLGVFLDKLITLLESEGGVNKLTGKIQKEEHALPIEAVNEALIKSVETELNPLKLTQVPRITGKEPAEGAAYNKDEPPPPTPNIAAATGAKDNARIIQSVLDEISLPPIKAAFGGGQEPPLKVEMLPPFDATTMANYAPADSKLREPIKNVRVTLWAYSNLPEPPALKKDVADKRAEDGFGKVSMAMLKDSYAYPKDENGFKKGIGDEEREVAKMLSNLIRLRKDFVDSDGTGKDRKEEPSKRWQVNYDYVKAHLEAQIAFLYEYQAMLGGLRKELPPKEPGTNRWHMVPTSAPSLDSDGKKMAKSSGQAFDALITENAGTPWFVLAKRERMVSLGLEWKSVK